MKSELSDKPSPDAADDQPNVQLQVSRARSALRRLGDGLIVVSGGDRAVLERWGVDRTYFVGLGVALIFAATIGTTAITGATAIIWDPPVWVLVITGTIYFCLILGLDRWLVSDPTAGFDGRAYSSGAAKAGAWLAHFGRELVKVLPRILISAVSSLLFAQVLLLSIYGAEIGEQLKADDVVANEVYQQRVDQQVELLTADSNTQLQAASDAKSAIQQAFIAGQQQLAQAAATRDAAQQALLAKGIECRNYTTTWTSSDGVTHTSTVRRCPPEWTAYDDAYNAVASQDSETQAQVTAAEAAIDKKYDTSKLEQWVSTGARAEAEKSLKELAPDNQDGLLARERALEQLTTPPAKNCTTASIVTPTPTSTASQIPTASDPATGSPSASPAPVSASTDPYCAASLYSADAANQLILVRLWIFLLEIAPVVMKFVRAITPRTGYATVMAGTDEEARAEGSVRSFRAQARLEFEKTRARDEQIVASEVAATEKEIQLREVSRQRLLYRLGDVARRYKNARETAEAVRTRDGFVRVSDIPDLVPSATPPPMTRVTPKRILSDDNYLKE